MEGNKTIVFAVPVKERLQASLFEKLLQQVDVEKRDRITRFRRWQDAHLSLFADLLVRSMLIRHTGLKNPEIHFSISEHGKPIVAGLSNFHFNLSHSGEWVVGAIDNKEVGIDVEQITDIDLSISENYFSPMEHNDILYSPDPQSRFFEFWALKESYIKCIGKGLSQSLNSFCIKFRNDSSIGIEVEQTLIDHVYFKQYNIANGYKMAACGSHLDFSECLIYSTDEIISFILFSPFQVKIKVWIPQHLPQQINKRAEKTNKRVDLGNKCVLNNTGIIKTQINAGRYVVR